jgi:hypothetical protein
MVYMNSNRKPWITPELHIPSLWRWDTVNIVNKLVHYSFCFLKRHALASLRFKPNLVDPSAKILSLDHTSLSVSENPIAVIKENLLQLLGGHTLSVITTTTPMISR